MSIFNKISSIRQNISENPLQYYTLSIDYGVDKEKKVEFTGILMGGCGQNFEDHYKKAKTRIYVNDLFTEETAGNKTKSLNYIFAGSKIVEIHEISANSETHDIYLHSDNLGSVVAYSDESGKLAEELSYDAWGRRRDPETWDYYSLSNDSISEYNTGFTGHDHIDMFNLVNMEGRMYDPLVGRFMSPDPIVQMPEYTQSLNRYAYCINNPLSLTDPTGYSWIGDTFSTLVGIAVGLETGGFGIYGAVIGGMAGGASSALVNSIINGANLMQTAKNTFTGGFWGGVSGFANFEIGNLENVYMKIAAHSVSEGAMEGIRGGHFEHGFFTGMASAAGGAALNGGMCDRLSAAERVAVNAVLGGIVSEIGGGKFASGAMTAAYVMMFNELKHKYRVRRKIKFKKICQVPYSDSPSAIASLTLKAVVDIIETHINSVISLDAYANEFSSMPDATNISIEISALGDDNVISLKTFSRTYTGPEALPTGWRAVGEAHISPFGISHYKGVDIKITPTWSFTDYGMGRCVPNLFSLFNPITINMFNSKTYKIK